MRSDQTVYEQMAEERAIAGRTPDEMERLGGNGIPRWQQLLGNQTVSQLMQPGSKFHRDPSGDPRGENQRSGRRPAIAGAGGARNRKNPFSHRAGGDGPGAMNPNTAQRYVTSAGFKILGNKVKFESSGLAATLPAALVAVKTASDLEIHSSDYNASGTVKATGPKAHVKNYEVGMLQTVYRSDRTYYYRPETYNPGLGERIGTAVLPAIFSNRYKVTDTLDSLPVRDGDTGVKPWYEISDTQRFDEAKSSTKSTQLYDQPGTQFPWKKTVEGTDQVLVKTGGADVFRTWLSVQEVGTTGFMGMHRLGYIDWEFNYETDVGYNKANPASSTVTPTKGGGKVLGITEGPGIKLPYMDDPVANDTTKEVEGWW